MTLPTVVILFNCPFWVCEAYYCNDSIPIIWQIWVYVTGFSELHSDIPILFSFLSGSLGGTKGLIW